MARNPQIKVAVAPYRREILDWGAQQLGLAPATYAAELLGECLSRVLDDPVVRKAYMARVRRPLEALESDYADLGEGLSDREIRTALRPREAGR